MSRRAAAAIRAAPRGVAGGESRVFARPAHPYTQGLIRSTPGLEAAGARLVSIEGSPPGLLHPPPGCPFLPRCPIGDPACAVPQDMRPAAGGGLVACRKAGTPAWAAA